MAKVARDQTAYNNTGQCRGARQRARVTTRGTVSSNLSPEFASLPLLAMLTLYENAEIKCLTFDFKWENTDAFSPTDH